jgi:hypothetical protein
LTHVLILVPDPAYPEPWAWAFHVEADALRGGGLEVSARPWTAPGDLDPFDGILPLVAWGYHERYDEWLSLLDRLEQENRRVFNPVPLLRWNSDKAYLAELDAKGVPTVHTIAVEALDDHALAEARIRFACETLVVKPPVSASATGTHKIGRHDPIPREASGRPMLIQPFLPTIASVGEYSVMLFDGFQPRHHQAPEGRRLSRAAASRRDRGAMRPAAGVDRAGSRRIGCGTGPCLLCAGRYGHRRSGPVADHGAGADRALAVAAARARWRPSLRVSGSTRDRTAIGVMPR